MAFQEKQLGQASPGSTPASLYTLPVSTTTAIKSLIICNTSSSPRTFSVFQDTAGTTYNASTALFFNTELEPNTTTEICGFMALSTAGGSIGVSADTTAVTFTLNGAEIT